MSERRRLAAVMFTDICGYTSMMGKDEAIALQTLEKNRNIHQTCIRQYNGHFVKEVGDGIIAWFESSTQAVECALDILKKAREEGYSLRFGIHQDDVIFRENDILGSCVNVASRIEAAATPDSIMFSDDVNDSIGNQSHLSATRIGHYQLKNDTRARTLYALSNPPAEVPKPHNVRAKFVGEGPQDMWRRIAIVAVIAAVVFSALWVMRFDISSDTPSGTDRIVLAIMPFETSGEMNELQVTASSFAAGLSERMSNIPGIITIPAHETTNSKRIIDRSPLLGSFDFASLAKEMHATHYITGVLKEKLSLEMRKAGVEEVLWSGTFPMDNPHRSIEDIAHAIIESLGISTDRNGHFINRDPKASNLYLEALKLWYARSVESNLLKAIDLLKQAHAIEPAYPEVTGLLSLCYATGTERGFFDFDTSAAIIYNYAEETLQLDPDNAHGILSLGTYYSQLWDYDTARKYYLRAFNAAPDKGITSQALGELDLITGRYMECLERFKDARRAAPHDQYVLEHVAFAEMANGFPNAYKRLYASVVDMYPESADSVSYRVYFHLVHEEYDKANDLLTSNMGENPKAVWILTDGIISVESGDQERYAKYINRVGPESPIGVHVRLLWLLHHGNPEQVEEARQICAQMMSDNSFPLIYLVQTYPLKCFNTLRTDPKIQDIAGKHGIAFTEHPYFKMKREFSPE